jgi:predicted flavoprotein YhiN
MPNEPVTKLMGIVAENALVSVQGTKLRTDGPLLITHWGMSGPAILKSSAFGARLLSEKNYQFNAQINWVGVVNNNAVQEELQTIIREHPNKILANYRPYLLPERLWHFLEFVTCGGVSLDSINMKTMESTACPNLYFCGEVMDIDGITGGYNFQAAWTTGYVAGKLL